MTLPLIPLSDFLCHNFTADYCPCKEGPLNTLHVPNSLNGLLGVWLHLELPYQSLGDFSDSSVGKESARNTGDHSSIPGLGRSAGEGISYPVQYSWASLVAQLIKNPLAVWETWV